MLYTDEQCTMLIQTHPAKCKCAIRGTYALPVVHRAAAAPARWTAWHAQAPIRFPRMIPNGAAFRDFRARVPRANSEHCGIILHLQYGFGDFLDFICLVQ